MAKKRKVSKDKKTKIPKKYLSGLKGAKRSKRASLLKRMRIYFRYGLFICTSKI